MGLDKTWPITPIKLYAVMYGEFKCTTRFDLEVKVKITLIMSGRKSVCYTYIYLPVVDVTYKRMCRRAKFATVKFLSSLYFIILLPGDVAWRAGFYCGERGAIAWSEHQSDSASACHCCNWLHIRFHIGRYVTNRPYPDTHVQFEKENVAESC